MLKPKFWLSGNAEYQKFLPAEVTGTATGPSDCSCSSGRSSQSDFDGSTDEVSYDSTSAANPGSGVEGESAAHKQQSIPPWVSELDPARFGPFSQPSEELQRLAAVVARDRRLYESARQDHKHLVGLLSSHDWKLLRWSERRLVRLAAYERLGPASLDKAALNPELGNLLHQRIRAWIRAYQIVEQWQRLRVDMHLLRDSFNRLWPTKQLEDHLDLDVRSSPEHESNIDAYVEALAMYPDAPEYDVLYQDLPYWAQAWETGAMKRMSKSTRRLL